MFNAHVNVRTDTVNAKSVTLVVKVPVQSELTSLSPAALCLISSISVSERRVKFLKAAEVWMEANNLLCSARTGRLTKVETWDISTKLLVPG